MSSEKVAPDERTEEEAFPQIECGADPVGSRIIVQLRKTRSKSKSGIIYIEETRSLAKYNEVVCKVVKVGPLAYRSPTTLDIWPEGAHCKVGDLIRTIKWGGDRYQIPDKDGEWISFIIINAEDVLAVIPNYESARLMVPFVEQ